MIRRELPYLGNGQGFLGTKISRLLNVALARIRVFHSSDLDRDYSFIYTYETFFFHRLGLKLLLTNFECIILCQVNIALTQVHPNSQALVCSFKILMEFLGIEPFKGIFFTYFQAKGVWKVNLDLFKQSSKEKIIYILPKCQQSSERLVFKIMSAALTFFSSLMSLA